MKREQGDSVSEQPSLKKHRPHDFCVPKFSWELTPEEAISPKRTAFESTQDLGTLAGRLDGVHLHNGIGFQQARPAPLMAMPQPTVFPQPMVVPQPMIFPQITALPQIPPPQPRNDNVFLNQDGFPITLGARVKFSSGGDGAPAADTTAADTKAADVDVPMVDVDDAPLVQNFKKRLSRRFTMFTTPTSPRTPQSHVSSEVEDLTVYENGSTPKHRQRHPSEDYEEFPILQPHVNKLLTEVLWQGRPRSDFSIQKLGGGTYNRVIAIRVKSPPQTDIVRRTTLKVKRALSKISSIRSKDRYAKSADLFKTTHNSGDYILRIPRLYRCRHTNFDFKADAVMHDFVKSLGIACPKVIHYQQKDVDDAPWPFLLQNKIAGAALSNYGTMTHEQKVQIATQIGSICKKMTSKAFPKYGKLIDFIPQHKGKAGATDAQASYKEPEWLSVGGESENASVARIIEAGMFDQYMNQGHRFGSLQWAEIKKMIRQIDDEGAFGKTRGWYFTHGDFFPRNIMADIDSEDHAHVTAVLDWDMATFQPAVMACRAPAWLWWWEAYHFMPDADTLDIIASVMPENPEHRQIKQASMKLLERSTARSPMRDMLSWRESSRGGHMPGQITQWDKIGTTGYVGSHGTGTISRCAFKQRTSRATTRGECSTHCICASNDWQCKFRFTMLRLPKSSRLL